MQRLMSCDPRGTWPVPGASPLTSMCHKFHSTRIQAAEKLKYEIKRRRFDPYNEDLVTDERLCTLIGEIAQLASMDVKIADQLGRTSDEADRIRQHFQRYQTLSGGLSPNPEVDETNISSSFDDLRVSPATLPRSADANVVLSPRFRCFEAPKKDQHITDFQFPSSSSSTLSASVRYNFKKLGGVEKGQTPVDPSNDKLQPSTTHPPISDRSSRDIVKAAKNQIVNKDRTENKIHDVEIYVSDYDKLPNGEKSGVKFASVPSRDKNIAIDSEPSELRKVNHSVRISCGKEAESEQNKRNNKETLRECQDKRKEKKIDSDKSHDSKPGNKSSERVASSTLPRPQTFKATNSKIDPELKNLQPSKKNKGPPPQVPIKKPNLSTIKTRNIC